MSQQFQFVQSSAVAKKPTFQKPSSQPAATTTTTTTTQQQNGTAERRPGSDISTAGFEIGTLGATHVIAVNKFCYARPSLMLVTADGHRRQHEPLDESDLRAAREALTATAEGDYMVFYNGGKDAGCSRLHKHMQLMPLPGDCFAAFLDNRQDEPDVPFEWAHHRFEADFKNVTVEKLVAVYKELLETSTKAWKKSVSLETQEANRTTHGAACPHNWILTKRWMMVIPRRQAAVGQAATNAPGMLGFISVAAQEDIDNWIRLGVRATIETLGVPRS